MISKEKILDEFSIKLRMKSVQLTFYISFQILLFIVMIKKDWKIDASYILYPQIIGYFIIYKIKRSLIIES